MTASQQLNSVLLRHGTNKHICCWMDSLLCARITECAHETQDIRRTGLALCGSTSSSERSQAHYSGSCEITRVEPPGTPDSPPVVLSDHLLLASSQVTTVTHKDYNVRDYER
ncbi:hypothetical protein AOLI_G00184750 [Acnodon oligacanthus]